MSDGKHEELRQAVLKMMNSMEALSVDASGITRGSWVQAHLKKVQDLLWEAPQMPASGIGVSDERNSGIKVGLLDLSNTEVRPPAPTPTLANDKCESTGTFGASVNKLAHCQRCTMYQMCLRASGERPPLIPAPEPKGFGLDAKIDKIMATMPKDWNGKYFFILIGRMVETFISKNTDYAGLDNQAIDCLANFRASTQLNVTPLKGVLVRCSDKWMRIQNLTREERVGMVKDEAIVDTMLDLANYMIIAVMVHMTTHDIKGE